MRSHLRSPGHGGRAGTLLRSLGTFVVLAILGSTTAFRPAEAAGQTSFAGAGRLGSADATAPRGGPELRPVSPSGPTRPMLALGVFAMGTPVPAPPAVSGNPARYDAAALAALAVETADRFVGTRYRWGGTTPSGFDCSGFVQYVYRQQGIELPRVSREQARAGVARAASLDELAPGDLLFFAQRGPAIDHVAIYAGDGRIVHSSRSGYGVRYDELSGGRGRYYAQHLVAVRRIIDPAALDRGALQASDENRETALAGAFAELEAEPDDDAPPPESVQ